MLTVNRNKDTRDKARKANQADLLQAQKELIILQQEAMTEEKDFSWDCSSVAGRVVHRAEEQMSPVLLAPPLGPQGPGVGGAGLSGTAARFLGPAQHSFAANPPVLRMATSSAFQRVPSPRTPRFVPMMKAGFTHVLMVREEDVESAQMSGMAIHTTGETTGQRVVDHTSSRESTPEETT